MTFLEKKTSERGDRQEKGWEKWDNHHTMPERLWEVIVLQRMSSFPTCSVKYLPNYLLILTRRSLLIIWPDQHYYHFYELPLLLARWGLISDLTKVILILWIWWNNTFLQWIISPPNHFCPLPQGVLKTAQQPLYYRVRETKKQSTRKSTLWGLLFECYCSCERDLM